MLTCPTVTAPQPAGSAGGTMAAAVAVSSPLSPFSIWQDLLASPEMEDHADSNICETTMDNIHSVLSIISADRQSDTVSVSDISNHYSHSGSMSTFNAQPETAVYSSPANNQNADSSEGAKIYPFISDLTTISAQQLVPLTTPDGVVNCHLAHQSNLVSELVNPLCTLAAIAEQHQVHVSDKANQHLPVTNGDGSRGNAVSGPQSVIPLAVSTNQEQRAVNVVRESRQSRSHSKKSFDALDVSKIDSRLCEVCGERASGHYFGALVCLPCKSFFIRCTKGGEATFPTHCGGKCDILKAGRIRCQFCRFQRCLAAGMYRKEKPEAVVLEKGQVLCQVCSDIANGVHFGVNTCEGCKKFFRRALKEHQAYTCKANGKCTINPRMRNNCRYCRFQKCQSVGMSREAIKMGRPKKRDTSTWCSLSPSTAVDKKTQNQCSNTMTLNEDTADGVEESEEETASLGEVGTLENSFTLEAVCDSSYVADEFLGAVSMGLEHNDLSVENESTVSTSSTTAERHVTPAFSSPSSSSCSPLDPAVSSVSTSRDNVGMGRPVLYPPVSAESCLLQARPDLTVTNVVSSSAFPTNQDHFLSSLPQQSDPAVVGKWARDETQWSNASIVSAEYPAAGHTECSPLSSPFLDSPRGDSELSPPCCCNPCDCSSPISDCDSPGCLADYRSQMHCLPSAFVSQPSVVSSQPLLPAVSVGKPEIPAKPAKHSSLPVPPHVQHDQFTPAFHAFSQPAVPSQSRLQYTPQRKGDGHPSLASRHSAPATYLPYSPPDEQCTRGTCPDPSALQWLTDNGASAPHLRLLVADELDNMRDSFRKSSVQSSFVQDGGIGTPSSSAGCGKQDIIYTQVPRQLFSQSVGCGKSTQERQNSRRRRSDSVVDCIPHIKVQRFSYHLKNTGGHHEVPALWTGPLPVTHRSDAFTRRRWSLRSNQQSCPQLLSSFAPLAQQQCNRWADLGLPRSYSQNSLHQSYSDVSSDNTTCGSVLRSQQLSSVHPNWQGPQPGAYNLPTLVKQERKQYGNDSTVRTDHKRAVLSLASVVHQVASTAADNPGTGNVCQQSAFTSMCQSNADAIKSVTDRNGSVNPLTSALSSFSTSGAQRNDLGAVMSHSGTSMTTVAGTIFDVTNTNIASTDVTNITEADVTRATATSVGTGGASTVQTQCVWITTLKGEPARTTATSSQTSRSPVSVSRQDCTPRFLSNQRSPAFTGRSAGGMSAACPVGSMPSPAAADFAPAATALSCTATCDGASTVRCAYSLPNPGTLEAVNRYFLNLDNSCEKNTCGEDHQLAQQTTNMDHSQGCRECQPRPEGAQVPEVKPQWRGVCLRRCHRYWHGYRPSLLAVHMRPPEAHLLASLDSALRRLRDSLRQLHKESRPGTEKEEQTTYTPDLLQRLHQQNTAIAAMSRRFLLAMPGGNTIASEDVELLSQNFGISSALILLSSQAFDSECRRFREVLNWTVGLPSPLFSFKVQLLTVASALHSMALDRTETALLCGLSLVSTDVSGLQSREAIQGVRETLLNSIEAYVASRDQGSSMRVKRLFSVLPDVRLMSAWFCALVSHL